MIAAVGVSKTVMSPSTEPVEEATVEIFIAVKDLPTAQKISADGVKLEKWPKNRLPEGALVKLEQLEGKFTNQMIFANEPILAKKISDSRESFSTNIPNGYRVFDINCNAGYIKPGDHVDITGTFKIGGRNAVPETRNVLRNVQVIGINGITTRDSEALKSGGKGTIFQLLVKDSQLEALTTAHTLGTLSLNLRPLGEGNAEDETDNGDQFLTWLNKSQETEADIVPEPKAVVEKTEQVFTAIQSMLGSAAPVAQQPTQQMTIITPNGVTKYEWSNEHELPKLVKEQEPNATPVGYNQPPTNPWQPSGNVYSGYGGYSPTYPSSPVPQEPAPGTSQTVDGPEEGETVD